MKEQLAKTGITVIGVVTDVNYIEQIGKHVITLMIAGMDNMLKVTLDKGELPDPKIHAVGNVTEMKITISQWNGNTYYNKVR